MKRCRGFEKQQICLPEELLVEILEWLPAKLVARFRCVAKPWAALFKEPMFIENHRRKQGDNGTMLLVSHRLQSEHTLSFHDLNSPEIQVRPLLSISFLKDLLQLESDTPALVLLGSCNGIVCIMYGCRYVLCNPALRDFKPLPPCSSYCPHSCKGQVVAHGYGVASGNDFKAIVMHTIYQENTYYYVPNIVIVHVYSSRTNSWRQIDDAPVYPVVCFINDYVVLSDAWHWAGRALANDRKMILSLDINSEVFKQLELPDCLSRLESAYPIPIVLSGGLLGIVEYQEWFDAQPVAVWGMKEYGVKESWTKMFVLSSQPRIRTILPWENDILVMLEHGQQEEQSIQHQDQLDENSNELTSISMNTNQMKNFQVFGVQNTMRATIYEETLVTLN